MIKVRKLSSTSIHRRKPWNKVRFDQKGASYLLYDFCRVIEVGSNGHTIKVSELEQFKVPFTVIGVSAKCGVVAGVLKTRDFFVWNRNRNIVTLDD
jgi:hypothetical protein